MPDDYELRPAGAQLQRQGLTCTRTQRVSINAEGAILNGRDLLEERAPPAGAPPQ